jgi:predicted DNA-binding transcriptional regulator AlpA
MQTQSQEQSQADGREHFAPRRLLSFDEVQRRYGGAHRTTLWRWWRSGLVPGPVRIGGGRKLFWYEDEIEAAIAKLKERRPAAGGSSR